MFHFLLKRFQFLLMSFLSFFQLSIFIPAKLLECYFGFIVGNLQEFPALVFRVPTFMDNVLISIAQEWVLSCSLFFAFAHSKMSGFHSRSTLLGRIRVNFLPAHSKKGQIFLHSLSSEMSTRQKML